ncbi:hypothetical protein [Parasitella parasitica]|uniref:Tyrosine specific protein phosphatases domain-containing protein n=1 Tax=Parasitella parasitica TaxID=35722 RepID=A0A0B7NHS5_9FUNG|nr:hypothetical protein [Parasitella parasitica]
MISVIKSPNTNQKFLLSDAPTKKTLPEYIHAFQQENVSDLIRICHRPSASSAVNAIPENEYDAEELEKSTGIKVNDDIKFEDGGVPSPEAISRWLDIAAKAKEKDTTVGVHCIAGIGRAPVLVAISLVEEGMDPLVDIQ